LGVLLDQYGVEDRNPQIALPFGDVHRSKLTWIRDSELASNDLTCIDARMNSSVTQYRIASPVTRYLVTDWFRVDKSALNLLKMNRLR
jgi:hypothetical protein